MDDYLGAIKIFAGDYAPRNFMKCEGQLMDITKNQALYSLLGTIYGGDGKNTFMLPDLRGRLIIDSGQGRMTPGDLNSAPLTQRIRGQKGGLETVTLTLDNIPAHTHTFSAISGDQESKDPKDNYLGKTNSDFYGFATEAESLLPMAAGAVGMVGGKGHENMPPYLCLTYIICVSGNYPPRPE